MKKYRYPKNKYRLLDIANQYKPLNFVLVQIFDFNNTFIFVQFEKFVFCRLWHSYKYSISNITLKNVRL